MKALVESLSRVWLAMLQRNLLILKIVHVKVLFAFFRRFSGLSFLEFLYICLKQHLNELHLLLVKGQLMLFIHSTDEDWLEGHLRIRNDLHFLLRFR